MNKEQSLKELTQVKRLHVFLVGEEGAEQLEVITAVTPKHAWSEYCRDYEPEYPNGIVVFSANPCLPSIDAEHALEMYSDANAEESPLEESWVDFVGKEKIAALQAIIDAHIAEHFPRYFMAGEVLYQPASEAKS